MSCTKQFSLGPALGDNPMDSAIDTGSFIIGIRGNRVFQCNRTTGVVIQQADLGTFGRNGCVAYDSGSGKIFASAWNTPHYDLEVIPTIGSPTESVSNRSLYRINPSNLAIEIVADITTSFGLTQFGVPNTMAAQEAGICAMEASGGYVYCRYLNCFGPTSPIGGGTLRFLASNIATFDTDGGSTVGGYPNLVYAAIGGHACSVWPDQLGLEFWIFDFTDGSLTNTYPVAPPKNMLAVGFAPTQQHVFVTNVAQLIYVYSTVGALVTTIDTGRSAFNGLAVRRNPTTGFMYVPGGNDNSVAIINPATNILSMQLGFDCPVDIVAAGALTFAVQAGSTPLKLIA